MFVLERSGEKQGLDWITAGVCTWETLFKQCPFFVISRWAGSVDATVCNAPGARPSALQTRRRERPEWPAWEAAHGEGG